MDGLPSTVTNGSIYKISFPAKISCHVPQKKNMADVVTSDIAYSLLVIYQA